MNYCNLIEHDFASGPGVRVSLFISGCSNRCEGCFNEAAKDYNYGNPFDESIARKIETLMSSPMIEGLSILGGDPLTQDGPGLCSILNLIRIVKHKNVFKNVWLWTGLTWESIVNGASIDAIGYLRYEIVKECDVIVDGPFVIEKKDLSLAFRGSSNQRIIDVSKSEDSNIVELDI